MVYLIGVMLAPGVDYALSLPDCLADSITVPDCRFYTGCCFQFDQRDSIVPI